MSGRERQERRKQGTKKDGGEGRMGERGGWGRGEGGGEGRVGEREEWGALLSEEGKQSKAPGGWAVGEEGKGGGDGVRVLSSLQLSRKMAFK